MNSKPGKMKAISQSEIIEFLRGVEPLEDKFRGRGYRASAYLIDGTYLPCVVFRSPGPLVDMALRRFDREHYEGGATGYVNAVTNFVTRGNCINFFNIARLETSAHFFPANIMRQIQGETSMGWTAFVARMKDGKLFSFGTGFNFEFFDMPTGYSGHDVVEIINHSYVDVNGELKGLRGTGRSGEYLPGAIYLAKPFFECFLDNL